MNFRRSSTIWATLLFLCTGMATALPASDEDAFWEQIETEIQNTQAVRCSFTETRAHPLRKRPGYHTGTLRYDSDLGLSLDYSGLFSTVQIIDDQGLIRRTSEDSQRTIPMREEMLPFQQALVAALSFDTEALEEQFEVSRIRNDDGEDWRLNLIPREDLSEERLDRITLDGTGKKITKIVFDLGPQREVTFELSNHQFLEEFPPDEKKAYFR